MRFPIINKRFCIILVVSIDPAHIPCIKFSSINLFEDAICFLQSETFPNSRLIESEEILLRWNVEQI